VVAGSRSHGSEREGQLLGRLGEIEKLALGSSLKFCRIAEGAADLYLRLGPTSEWDTAAAQCVVEQTGGAVLTLDGAPLRYNTKESLLNPDFLACGDAKANWPQRLGTLT
jgi:3'(2'), 5'-bisphosphate nucleotidase